MQSRSRSILQLILFIIPLFGFSSAWGSEVTRDFYVAPTGTIPSITEPHIGWTEVGCYDALTGEWLNCKFTQKIIGIKEPDSDINNSGGHSHPDHPLIEPKSASMKFDGMKCPIGVGPLEVCGYTNYTSHNLITHGIPQASGKIVKKTVIEAPPPRWPPNWWCYFGCDLTYTYIDIFNVEVPGLKYLPDAGPADFYIKVRGGAGAHPEAYYGTGFTVQALQLVAQNYWVLSGRKLSINDMSLPAGGMFDLNDQWYVTKIDGHVSHRTGTDVDINQDDVSCSNNKDLRSAIDMLLPFVQRPGRVEPESALLCESGGRIHIDMD